MPSIHKAIETRINAMTPGSIFSFEEFSSMAKYGTIKKTILRIVQEGKISRIHDGIFMIPKISKLTGETMPPSIPAFANCLANKFKWNIVPCGDSCLNMLGLSTQMPAKYEYISDGPYRKYKLNGMDIHFKHTSESEIKNLSYNTATLIQAIKAFGKDNLDAETKSRLKNLIPDSERILLLTEAKGITTWVYDIILDIAGENK